MRRRRCCSAVLTMIAAGGLVVSAAPAHATPVPQPAIVVLHQQPAPTPEADPSEDAGTGGVRWDEFGGTSDEAPQDLDSFIDTTLGWLKTLTGYAGVLGVLIVAALMVIGIKGRSEAAKKAVDGLPAVVVATIISGAAYTFIRLFTG